MESSDTFDVVRMGDHLAAKMTRNRAAGAAIGVALTIIGLARSGVARPLFMAGGLALLVRFATNKPFKQLAKSVWASVGRGRGTRYGEGERDLVDEASWESFPASDPPSFSHGTSRP